MADVQVSARRVCALAYSPDGKFLAIGGQQRAVRLLDSASAKVVADLPERQRHAVVLKYVVDLEHASIAKALGTTPTMSRRLVSDALASLRIAALKDVI